MKLIRKQTVLGAVALAALCAGAGHAQTGPLANTSREAVNFSQRLSAGAEIELGERGAAASSRSYQERVTGADLARGVDIVTQGAGAVVRVTPVGDRSQGNGKALGRLKREDLEIARGGGAPVAIDQSGALVADQAELKASMPELFEDTIAFKMSDTMGKGRFKLKSKGAVGASDSYVIQVFDKASDAELTASSARQTWFAGERLSARVALSGGMKRGAQSKAELLGPNGQRFPLDAAASGDGLDISGALPAAASFAPGELWRVAVSYREQGGAEPVWRDAELALAVGKRAASVGAVRKAGDGLAVEVNVAEAGRYEARAWLYARGADTAWKPAMLVYGAKWLDAGAGEIALAPDYAALEEAGYRGPYKVRQLQLLDQSRLMALDTKGEAGLPTVGE